MASPLFRIHDSNLAVWKIKIVGLKMAVYKDKKSNQMFDVFCFVTLLLHTNPVALLKLYYFFNDNIVGLTKNYRHAHGTTTC
jgi:hypothetical protein